MSGTAIFWPMIAQVVLIHAVYLIVSMRRVGSVKAGSARLSDFAVPFSEPEPSATAVRNLINQFELPLLFLIVCVSLFALGGATPVAVVLAWLFVLSRIAHTYVHVTDNRVLLRRRIFIAGFLVNGALWILLAVQLVRLG